MNAPPWLTERRLRALDAAIAVSAAAVVAGLVFGWRVANPAACLLGGDALIWAQAADGVLEGSLGATAQLNREPVVPIATAAFATVLGDVPAAGAALSAVLGAAHAALVYLLATRWFGRGAGLLALLVTFRVESLRQAAEMQADVAFQLAFLVAIAAVIESRLRRSTGWWAATGVAVAIAMMTKPQALLITPLVLALSWRDGGLRAMGAAAAGLAGAILPWELYQALAGPPGGAIGLALGDVFAQASRPHHPLDRHFAEEGLPTGFLYGPAWLRVPGLIAIGALRELRVLTLAPWVLLAPLAFWLERSPEPAAATARRTLVLAGACMVLALPALWQPRHLVPFVTVLLIAGASALPSIARRAPAVAAGLLVLAVLHAGVHGARTWRVWTGTVAGECTESARVAGAWLRENAARFDRYNLLAQSDPALAWYSGLPAAPASDRDPMLPNAPADLRNRLWLVVAPGLAPQPQGPLASDVEEAWRTRLPDGTEIRVLTRPPAWSP